MGAGGVCRWVRVLKPQDNLAIEMTTLGASVETWRSLESGGESGPAPAKSLGGRNENRHTEIKKEKN